MGVPGITLGAVQARSQWLVWKFESQPGDKKPRKVPYYAGGARRTGEQGSDDDRAQLVSYATAQASAATGRYSGIGFAFLPGDGLIGIDLDSVIDEDGVFSERARNIIAACGSYTEYSPSKRGVHIFVAGESDTFKNNAIGVEVFCGRQFFTWTGDHVSDTPVEIRPVEAKTLARLRATVRGEKKSGARSATAPAATLTDELVRAESALAFLGADDYHQWIEIGLALKASLGEAGFALWDRWSMRSVKYPGTDATGKRWATFQPTGISVGTVFELAKRAGWSAPRQVKAPRSRGHSGGGAPPPDGGGQQPSNAGGELPPKSDRTLIAYSPADTSAMIDKCLAAMSVHCRETIYNQGGRLVHIVEEPHSAAHAHALPPVHRIRTVAPGFLRDQVSLAAVFTNADGSREKKSPQEVIDGILGRGEWQLQRRLSGIVSTPFLRRDGSVCADAGYDESTGILMRPLGGPFPAVPPAPTMDDARAALDFLKCDVLDEFPFEGEADRSVAIASYMTPAIRPALPVGPIIAWDATTPGSGKTTGTQGISIVADGGLGAVFALPHEDEAELHKLVESALLSGGRVLVFDNIVGAVRSETLCAIATSQEFQFRILGRSETVKVANTATIIINGNNLQLVGDLSHRVLVCRLDPGMERPDRRTFKVPDFIAHVRSLRPRIIAAALTIARAYHCAKYPATGQEPWARFPDFDRFVRSPLLWLGEHDPLDTINRAAQIDPERQELQQVLDAISNAPLSAEAFTTHDLIEHAEHSNSPRLRELLRTVAGDRDQVSSKRLGKYLSRFAGRIVDDLQLVRHSSRRGVVRWKVQRAIPETNQTNQTNAESV